MYTLRVKKIVKPSEKEEVIYYSDFSGKCFGQFHPDVNVKIEFNYNSRFDGSTLELHLTDQETTSLLNFIKREITTEYKNEIKSKLNHVEQQLDISIQSRDWSDCDYKYTSIDLYKYLIDHEEE